MSELDNHYVNPRLAALYDLDSGWSRDRDFYLALAGPEPQRILDLGCGTGLICDAYAARGHLVTGADPADAMLEVARRKPHGEEIAWVNTSAQNFASSEKYDLIIMTGHAFQVLLDEENVAATFSSVRGHLKTHGRFVFESRNPAYDWHKSWTYEMPVETPSGQVIESRRLLSFENGHMVFELQYQFEDETLTSTSQLRFFSRQSIEKLLKSSGLAVKHFYGDWDYGKFDEATSEEMIFTVMLAP